MPQTKYPIRQKLFQDEDEFFKKNTHVGGMAADDNTIIINPYSPLKSQEKDAVAQLEDLRLHMINNNIQPQFPLTPKQDKYFSTISNGKPYSPNPQDIRETIVSRILVGDPTAQDVTPEQQKITNDIVDGYRIPLAPRFPNLRKKLNR